MARAYCWPRKISSVSFSRCDAVFHAGSAMLRKMAMMVMPASSAAIAKPSFDDVLSRLEAMLLSSLDYELGASRRGSVVCRSDGDDCRVCLIAVVNVCGLITRRRR